MEKWDKVYLQTPMFGEQWYPSEGVVRFTARYLQRRIGIENYDKKREIGRILDAGCGNGRHIVFFAEQGFSIWGVDISEEAILVASTWLNKKGLKAHLQVGDIKKLPFESQYFDVVISFGVLDHITFSDAKRALQEINRVSSKGAYMYIALRSTEDSECGRGEKVANNTFVLQEGYEKGIIQHFFDWEEIKELFKGFNIFDVELHEERFPETFTIDKAFIQSSRGERRFIDLLKPVDLNLKYSRWHIAAEKG